MRYTSSPPHAFRNRIAKSIGVLVAAALVASPAAAQPQPRHRQIKKASHTQILKASTPIGWAIALTLQTTGSLNKLDRDIHHAA